MHPCSVCVATVRALAPLGFTSTTHMRTRYVAHTGDSLLDAVRRAVPGVPVGKILIQRDEEHSLKLPQVVYPRCMQALVFRCCSCGSHCNGHHAHTCAHSWRVYLPLSACAAVLHQATLGHRQQASYSCGPNAWHRWLINLRHQGRQAHHAVLWRFLSSPPGPAYGLCSAHNAGCLLGLSPTLVCVCIRTSCTRIWAVALPVSDGV